ncbi:hypothetical protein TW83_16475 [Paracoccus sp. S4493]|nr:hypothetical protein TW83_16475 [Paracoccus sp. S4493]
MAVLAPTSWMAAMVTIDSGAGWVMIGCLESQATTGFTVAMAMTICMADGVMILSLVITAMT